MPVRVGVDVGGTFTKAVACTTGTGRIVARAVVATTHDAPAGVADGVVQVVGAIFEEVERIGAGPVLLVAHSTTQAVNALLEGDTARVGVLGIGRRPDLRQAERRTRVGEIRLAPGRVLQTIHRFADATGGLTPESVRAAIDDLIGRGAGVVCASEAYGVEDPTAERMALKAASDLGIPACAGHELSGLYGLELRTVTAAINASILPTALDTARLVETAVARRGIDVPLLVMRGDGGAAEIGTMRRRPLLTAFSGPAASVAGALRHLRLRDGVVVEVGGTSTNVSAVRGGRPVLSYVRVQEHVTSVRSLDVRVVGVAGGSLLRLARRLGRLRVTDAGPRSAHIAGLPYCAFQTAQRLAGAEARLISPRPGDPEEYVVVETPGGERFAPTVTCAANALALVPAGSHAEGDRTAARIAFEALGRLAGRPWDALAREAVAAAARKVAAVITDVLEDHGMGAAGIAGLGGGAGALVPSVAENLGVEWSIPEDAEVISSVGDALSLVRVEVERAMARPSAGAMARLVTEAEEAAVAAGAAPASLQVETQSIPERGAVRVVALGAATLDGAIEGDGDAPERAVEQAARAALGHEAAPVAATRFYTVFAAGDGDRRRFVVLDRRGSVATTGEGAILSGTGGELPVLLAERVPAMVRRLGPLAVAPAVRLLRGARLVDLSLFSAPDAVLEAAESECAGADGEPVVALLSRT